MANILDNLNDVQKQIVVDTEGPVLVLAGAGSGKTRVLTYRVAYLVGEKKVFPYNILAITFTNKATAEMKERLDVLLGTENRVWISTYHSLCATILRKFADRLGYDANFSIYDETDSNRVIQKVLREKHLENDSIKDRIKDHISEAKNGGLSPDEYFKDINGIVNDAELVCDIYERYEELLKLSNAMDFDDLLHKVKKLFEENPDVLEIYQTRFRYIHVDEFQDSNQVQYELVKMLAGKWGNIFVVGDDDQSIYGWRGAVVENILNFDKVFKDAKVYRLLENYRSTPQILDVANKVIRNNKARHEKELFTNRASGVRVEYFSAYNDYNEADWVIDNIMALKRHNGYTNKDFAILVRVNSLTRLFENKLSSCNMKYRVLGGFKFFDRKEIQDVIAYMRVIANTRDSEAIERIINFPRRGIGDTSIEKMGAYSREHGVYLIDVIFDITENGVLTGATAKKVEEFRDLIADLRENKNKPLHEFANYLVDKVGFEYAYTSTGKDEDFNRWENIQEFLRHIKEFAGQRPNATLEEFLQTVSLAPEREEELYDGEMITLATMHSVKGLEFKVVFIVGCEEDVFPSARCKKEGGIEEERRVMYVAVTRAKERLYISHAQKRFRFNKVQENLPSRFIGEAKGSVDTRENAYAIYNEKRAYMERRGPQPEYWNDSPKKSTYVPQVQPKVQPKIYNKDMSKFVGGAKVQHPVYGVGKILIVIGTGDKTNVTVAFEGLGVKKFILALAPLTLIK